ncbi:MAG: AsmA family protein [Flavobacterium sp.]|nr:MAG: AsmA family protein [Flavobacterium sp.]
MKKTLKIIGIVLLLLIVALFAVPLLFKDTIKAKIISTINKNVDATVSFDDADLSLFRSFPRATVTVDKLLILNKAPFAGDTLVSFGEISLKMSVKELFKDKSEPMNVEAFTTKNGRVNIIFNKDGLGNFDIALKNAEKKDDGKSDPLSLKIKEYKLENFRFSYYDERSKLRMNIDSLNHTGNGDFTASKLDLVTQSTARVSVKMDKTKYMDRVPLALDATLAIDNDKNIYTFKKNKALINQLPLEFDGSIQILDAGQQYDLTFRTPSSSFKNFLALIPSKYSGSLNNVKTSGDFTVAGFAKGLYSETTVPKFNVAIASNNASFQYPNLPKSVRNIVIDTKIINDTGILNDTYVNLDKLSFAIDADVFNAKANIKNVVENPLVNAELKGTINLGNLSKAYPIKLDKPLSGILRADVVTKFDMKSVENKQYASIYNSGSTSLTGFRYTDDQGKALNINSASVKFNPSHVNLEQLNATTGKTDLSVAGTLDNFYGFLFKDQVLQGNFTMHSNQLAVSDFMTEDKSESGQKKSDAMKIPAFLDCRVNATAGTVLYDNLVLKNVSGVAIVRDQKVTLQNVKTNIFGGLIGVNGSVSTKEKVPTFNMDLNLNSVDVSQSFTQLDMLKSIAPIAGVINGKVNSMIKVAGNLDAKSMTPNLGTIDGSFIGQLLSTTINANNSTLLTALDNNLSFIDLKKLNLNDLRAALTFNNGKVNLKPVTLKYQDIKLEFSGQHGFDQSMNYNLKFDLPPKYLGTEANKLLAQLTPADAAKIDNIPINAAVTGSFKNPKIKTDFKEAATNLTTQLIKMQRDKLLHQGTNALGNILSGGTKPKDSTKTNQPKTNDIKTQAGNILNGIFNQKKKDEPKKPAATPPK